MESLIMIENEGVGLLEKFGSTWPIEGFENSFQFVSEFIETHRPTEAIGFEAEIIAWKSREFKQLGISDFEPQHLTINQRHRQIAGRRTSRVTW